jgi:hypothetical protein
MPTIDCDFSSTKYLIFPTNYAFFTHFAGPNTLVAGAKMIHCKARRMVYCAKGLVRMKNSPHSAINTVPAPEKYFYNF